MPTTPRPYSPTSTQSSWFSQTPSPLQSPSMPTQETPRDPNNNLPPTDPGNETFPIALLPTKAIWAEIVELPQYQNGVTSLITSTLYGNDENEKENVAFSVIIEMENKGMEGVPMSRHLLREM